MLLFDEGGSGGVVRASKVVAVRPGGGLLAGKNSRGGRKCDGTVIGAVVVGTEGTVFVRSSGESETAMMMMMMPFYG